MTQVEYLWRLPTHGDGRRAHDKHTRGEWNSLPRVPAALERVRARQASAA
jgi:hypothetical protein